MASEHAPTDSFAVNPISGEPTYLAFVSYKGGVGRTLAATSCANALARGGSHVVLIDFDIDAPGIPSFYDIDAFEDSVEKGPTFHEDSGLVAWAVDRRVVSSAPDGVESVDRFGVSRRRLVAKKSVADHLYSVRLQSGPGSLRILPAGRVGEHLLRRLSDVRWQAWMRPRETELEWARQLAHELRAQIAEVVPRPRFVLIDATAGFDAPAYRVLNDLADKAIFLATQERGEEIVYRQLQATFGEKIQLVISRLPVTWPEAQEILSKSKLWSESGEGSKSILRHDPEFSIDPHPSIPAAGRFNAHGDPERPDEPFQLSYDHLRMLATVLSREVLDDSVKDNPEVSNWVRDALDEKDPVEYYKLFNLSRGTIFNPSDPERAANVSFRVTTIRRIFNDIWKALPDDPSRTVAFEEAGRHAGFKYGESLRNAMTEEGRGVDEMLRRWCREDSQVGFGELEVVIFDNDRGTVQVENAFLPPETDDDGQLLHGGASIFTGYVEGVLQGLLGTPSGTELRVRVDWKERDVASQTGTSALVTFTLASAPSTA